MVRPATKKHFLIEKSVASQDDPPLDGRLGTVLCAVGAPVVRCIPRCDSGGDLQSYESGEMWACVSRRTLLYEGGDRLTFRCGGSTRTGRP